jgi:hypothetical protein
MDRRSQSNDELQFDLRTVFLVTTLAAVFLGIFHDLTPKAFTLLAFWIFLPGLAFTFFFVCIQCGSATRSLLRWLCRLPRRPRP